MVHCNIKVKSIYLLDSRRDATGRYHKHIKLPQLIIMQPAEKTGKAKLTIIMKFFVQANPLLDIHTCMFD